MEARRLGHLSSNARSLSSLCVCGTPLERSSWPNSWAAHETLSGWMKKKRQYYWKTRGAEGCRSQQKSLYWLQHAGECVIWRRNSALGLLVGSFDRRKGARSERSWPVKTSGRCCARGKALKGTWEGDLGGKGTWSGVWFVSSLGRLTNQSAIWRRRGASTRNLKVLALEAGHHPGWSQDPREFLLGSDERPS